MIKRTLGLWADERGSGGRNLSDSDDDDSDPDPGLTTRQRRRLERRFVPGAEEGSMGPASKRQCDRGSGSDGAPSSASDSDDSEHDSNSSDDEPAMPVGQPKQIRGEYRCELCANKILLNAKALEQHLQSEGHKKNERRFEHAKEIGVEAYQAECMAKLEAKEAARGQQSKKKLKNSQYWEHRRAKSKISGKDKAENPTTIEIERRKLHFQDKKKRRLARKAGLVEEPVPASEGMKAEVQKKRTSDAAKVGQGPKRLNRKERRKALQPA